MAENINKTDLNVDQMENVSGGSYKDITEMHSTCKGCMAVTLWKKYYGSWHCSVCNGTESIPYWELPEYQK